MLELDSELESGKMVKDRNEDLRGGNFPILEPTSSCMERTGEEHCRTSEGTAMTNTEIDCFELNGRDIVVPQCRVRL